LRGKITDAGSFRQALEPGRLITAGAPLLEIEKDEALRSCRLSIATISSRSLFQIKGLYTGEPLDYQGTALPGKSPVTYTTQGGGAEV